MRITRYALFAVAALALALAGCGGGGNEESQTTTEATTSTGAAGQTIQISETEFTLDPSTVTVDTAGTYKIEVTNDGQVTHALEVEGNGLEEQKTGDISPGESATLTVELKAGKYEMYCPIDGHKQQGMEGDIEVSG